MNETFFFFSFLRNIRPGTDLADHVKPRCFYLISLFYIFRNERIQVETFTRVFFIKDIFEGILSHDFFLPLIYIFFQKYEKGNLNAYRDIEYFNQILW